MASIPKYKIIKDNYHSVVENKVNDLLYDGWHLYGILQTIVESQNFATQTHGNIYYIQTMIKY